MTMVKMINKLTGTQMWVAEERVKEYEAAGHKLAAEVPGPVKADAPKAASKKKPAARKK